MFQVIESFKFHYFPSLESTNATAKSFCEKSVDFCKEGLVHTFYADKQTLGYGKSNRKWLMKEGNVAVSFLLSSAGMKPQDITQLTFVFCLSVGRTLEYFGLRGSDIEYKWPNDVLVSGKKIGGILLESNFSLWGGEKKLSYIVAGIGVNVVHRPENKSVSFPVTSMKEAGGSGPKALEFIEKLSFYIKRYYNIFAQEGFEVIRCLWEEKAWRKEGTLLVKVNDKERVEGKFLGLKEDGALCIQCAESGKVYMFYSADVF